MMPVDRIILLQFRSGGRCGGDLVPVWRSCSMEASEAEEVQLGEIRSRV